MGLALALNRLGRVAYLEGKYAAARQRYQESLAISETIGDQRAIYTAYGDLGDASCALGTYGDACRYFQNALSLATNPYNTIAIVDLVIRVAEFCMHTNGQEDALTLVAFARRNFTGFKATRSRAESLSSTLVARLPTKAVEMARVRGESWDLPETVAVLRKVLGVDGQNTATI